MTGYDFTLIIPVFHAVEIKAKHFTKASDRLHLNRRF